ncbi:hypothetical protein G7Y89_g7361 [Cudoniella acicularis]|uniref:Uncharacterized protein n=1 Tax=Cudoniella acicularis TaxID=354080 RepID=A0A8H4W260_9HELO|nr:hypothetical protein G7Y89_g7361 [Cudoniella acicularis]
MLAIVHYCLFCFLDGKPADGPNPVLQQSWVSTISSVLASVFQLSLDVTLWTIFTQYLWYILRHSTLRVSTIEALFTIRSSPFSVFQRALLRHTPILLVNAILVWIIYFITNLPQGAYTIEQNTRMTFSDVVVPTFDPSFIGDSTGAEIKKISLDSLVPTLSELGTNTVGYEAGTNQCQHTNETVSHTLSSESLNNGIFPTALQRMATGVGWTNNFSQSSVLPMIPVSKSNHTSFRLGNTFNTSSWKILGVAQVGQGYDNKALISRHNLSCVMQRAPYTIDFIYKNNVQEVQWGYGQGNALVDFFQLNGEPGVQIDGLFIPEGNCTFLPNNQTVDWTPDVRHWHRDLQLMGIIGTVTGSIAGAYNLNSWTELNPPSSNTTFSDPNTRNITWNSDAGWIDSLKTALQKYNPESLRVVSQMAAQGPRNGTLIANTRLNKNNDRFNKRKGKVQWAPTIRFAVTPHLLNELLFNTTLSIMADYGFWNTTANATIETSFNTYSFSDPLKLTLPYGLSLLATLPFILLGFWALHENGVAAIDGGFIQLVTTSTGSATLEREAAKGCLGGDVNVSDGLKDLRIRFGELVRHNKEGHLWEDIRRAGFGTEEETVPIFRRLSAGTERDEQEERERTTSQWKCGIWTPILIGVSYLIALMLSIIHLVFFRYLDGKPAEGLHQVFPQSYVTTVSNTLASGFQLSLDVSMGTVFTQYLWYILRHTTLRVSTIEALFTMRSSPWSIFQKSVFSKGPLLLAITVHMWAVYAVANIPPGAINVVQTITSEIVRTEVPTFNASFMGNGSGSDAVAYALDHLEPNSMDNDTSVDLSSRSLNSGLFPVDLQRVANGVAVGGRLVPLPSPCGNNCSYTINFTGPYLHCRPENYGEVILPYTTEPQTIYSGFWTDEFGMSNRTGLYPFLPGNPKSKPPLYSKLSNTFATRTLSILALNSTETGPGSSQIGLVAQRNLSCSMYRADYTVNYTYQNSIQSMTVSIDNNTIQPLVKFNQLQNGGPGVPFRGLFRLWDPNSELNDLHNIVKPTSKPQTWDSNAMAWYRDLQLFNIIGAVTNSIAGGYGVGNWIRIKRPCPPVEYEGILFNISAAWPDSSREIIPSRMFNATTFKPGIHNTKLNTKNFQFKAHKLKGARTIDFSVTQDLLNELLLNTTLTLLTAFEYWQTTVDATVDNPTTVYSFSSPLGLLLPYGIPLLVSIPFMILGFWALHQNGVPAINGGFIQLIATSRGSAVLEREAAKGCLGGDVNVPEGLKNLEIRFGELRYKNTRSEGRDSIRRAGFGTKAETMLLTKGANYGIQLPDDEKNGWV